MISAGKKIFQKKDRLYKISVQHLYNALIKPKENIKELIQRLRTLKVLNPDIYKKRKIELPYVVPSIFSPQFRKKENFASSEYFILDIDDTYSIGMEPEVLKKKLIKDIRIHLAFISPGNDGLKIFFKLSEKCFDTVKYSILYTEFASKFAEQYNLEKVIDFSTKDVTRACFISFDPNTYYNPQPQTINIKTLVDFDDIFKIKQVQKEIKEIDKKNKKEKKILDKDEFLEIKKLLNPELAKKIERKKIIYVPPELDKIINDIKNLLIDKKLIVNEIKNIHYGKKIIFSYKHHKAEVNIFFGKKGFSVVKSPKTGTNPELAELGKKLIMEFLFT